MSLPLGDALVWIAGGVVFGMAGAALLTLLRKRRARRDRRQDEEESPGELGGPGAR